jgi:D-alanyl-D-alanine carboxypeptidase
MIAEAAERREEVSVKPPPARAERTITASVEPRAAAGSNDPIRPLLVKTISYRTAPVQTASLAPMPALVPIAASTPAAASQASPAAPAVPAQAPSRAGAQTHAEIAAVAPNVDGKVAQTEPSAPAASEPAPISSTSMAPAQVQAAQMQPAQIAPGQMQPAQIAPGQMQAAQIEPAPIERHTAAAKVQTVPAYSTPPAHGHGGWLIQIGAFDDEGEAKQHLSAAQIKVHGPLAAKDPFTERVQKGDKALYRARFAGFDKSTAEAACRALKRSDFECMALKD